MKAIIRMVMAVMAAAPLSLAAADAGGSLPDVDSVLKQVSDRAARESANDREFSRRYTFAESKVTEYRNGKGQLIKRDEKKSNKNSALVPAVYVAPPAAAGTAGHDEVQSKVHGQAFEKKDILLNEQLLKRFEFKVVGRDTIEGRAMIMIDFAPLKKDLPEKTLKDRFINKAAGRVWMDQADGALAKADLHLTSPVNVLGGLVGSVWKFDYSFERSRTSDGLWYTRAVDWHLEGREVIVNRTVDYHEQKSDVRRAM